MTKTNEPIDSGIVSDEWWPDLLRHMANEEPWSSRDVVVAELKSYDDPGYPGLRMLWSALVPTAEMKTLSGHLVDFNYHVETSGPHPSPAKGGGYRPWFRISAIDGERRIDCEPLVLSWTANNTTAMVLDPGFTMTYGLVPRAHSDGSIRWDNLEEPEYDVASIDRPSIYSDGRQSDAKVVIARDYLQDYLTLRDLELVQVYYETRRGHGDDAMVKALNGAAHRELRLTDRLFDLQLEDGGGYLAQVWGARRIAGPANLPISTDTVETEGLYWPGLDGAITANVARSFRPSDYVYASDAVLGAYEGQPGFRVNPETGGVSFGNQWSVSRTERVGRDVIRLEIKKLYEGVRGRVIQHWHDFAVAPTPELKAPQARRVKNVGTRAKALVYAISGLGERLADLSQKLNLPKISGGEIVGLDRAKLDYEGWWNGPHVEPICRHIPLNLDKSGFLNRCLALDKLAVEALQQKALRRLVRAVGMPSDSIDDLRGLKLLDRLVCLSMTAENAGLRLWESGDTIIQRYHTDGVEPPRPMAKLFALSDLRQVAGHRKTNEEEVIDIALSRFSLDRGVAAGGWGLVLDQIYDQTCEQVEAVERAVALALEV